MTTPPSPEMLRMARDCFGIHADLISDDLMNRLAHALAAAYQRGREDAAKIALHDHCRGAEDVGWMAYALCAAAIRSAP